jgi:hypothetical protein
MGNVNRRIAVHAGPRINMRPYLKTTKAERAEGETQVVDPLPKKWKALSSTPSTTKNK